MTGASGKSGLQRRPAPGCRLFVVLARRARRAVVFRRGPSKQVLLLSWDTETDRVTPGQWLKGRVYERRCDLSPSGERLVYFAGRFRGTGPACWTALSRPPYFTALALWPKDSAWGGGGLFETESRLRLNHAEPERSLAPGFRLPRSFEVEPLGEHAGWGEDFPLYELRLLRDGWRRVEAEGALVAYRRPSPARGLELEMRILATGGRGEPWHASEYRVREPARGLEARLGRLDWADWDVTGELLFARSGRLYRAAPALADGGELELSQAKEVADLRALAFEEKAAPDAATRW